MEDNYLGPNDSGLSIELTLDPLIARGIITQRTYNILHQMGINTIADLIREYSAYFIKGYGEIPSVKGLGVKCVNELKSSFIFLEKELNLRGRAFIDESISKFTLITSHTDNLNLLEDLSDETKLNYYKGQLNLNNSSLYISTDGVKGFNKNKDLLKNINLKLFEEYELGLRSLNYSTSFDKFIFIVLSQFEGIEDFIIRKRLNFYLNEDLITLKQVGEKVNITRERVRQLELIILVKIKFLVYGFSKTNLGQGIISDLGKSFLYRRYGFIHYFPQYDGTSYTSRLGSYILNVICNGIYNSIIIPLTDTESAIFLIHKEFHYIDFIEPLMIYIDDVVDKKRSEDVIYTVNDFITDVLNKLGIKGNRDMYEYFILNYIYFKYKIIVKDFMIILPKNKKDLHLFIKRELDNAKLPMHYEEVYLIVSNKYPEYKWNTVKVLGYLQKNGKNVGPGLYVSKENKMKGGTIVSLAEEYLIQKGEPVLYSEIIEFIEKNLIVKKNSIITLLQMNNDKFSFNKGFISLKI